MDLSRRKFLKGTATGAAGTALAGGVQSRQRLIEYQYPRRPREQPGQDHAPHLATAELVDRPRRTEDRDLELWCLGE